ncbi:MAG: hypothetical protein J0I07_39255 [Myxococcales bacterium]|nr:hypothetical protein [Myxococcales bacterium]
MNDPLSLDPATIAALRSRHVAFLAERLVDDRARGDFIRSFAGGYDHVMARPIRELLQPQTLVAGGAKLLTNEVVRGLLAPIAQEVNRRVVTSLRTDEAKLGDYVPREARAAIDELIARPDLLPEELVRRVFDAEVVEEIMRDVLYDALLEFNESVNPFFADWGLPALIKRFMPIGSGTVLKSMSAVRAEFDKRLEPEIRKFDFVVSSAGDPKLVALRKSIVAFFYEESLAQITQNVDDDARMNADEAALAIVLELLRKDRPRERLIAELEKLVAEHGDEPLGAWLARIGVTERPDLEGLAELLWPFAKLAPESPPARAFWERVTWDFYATLASPTASSPSGTVP